MVASTAFADEILLFKNGMKFNHTKHQTEKVGICSACHDQDPGKISGFGKDWSHKNCIECHASTKDDSVIAREDSFCVACHHYEAVKIDCFECHSGKRKSAWGKGASK